MITQSKMNDFFINQKPAGSNKRKHFETSEKPLKALKPNPETKQPQLPIRPYSKETEAILKNLSRPKTNLTVNQILSTCSAKQAFSHLLTKPTKAPPLPVPLPDHFLRTLIQFENADKTLVFFHMRKLQTVFSVLQPEIERNSGLKFEFSDLKKFEFLIKGIYQYQWVQKSEENFLDLVLKFPEGCNTQMMVSDNSVCTQRKNEVYNRLVALVNECHEQFLHNQGLTHEKSHYHWHPLFRLENVEEIPEAELPPKPEIIVKKPKFQNLESAAETDEEQIVTRRFKGIGCENLSRKISEQIHKSESRRKTIERRAEFAIVNHKIERLVSLSNQLKSIYLTQTTPSIFLECLVSRLSKDKQEMVKKSNIESDLLDLVRIFPEWLSKIQTKSGVVVRMNRGLELSTALITQKITDIFAENENGNLVYPNI